MFYTLAFQAVSTAATKDTAKTVAAIIGANTDGVRARIRKIGVGFGDDTPHDRAYAITLKRVASNLAGNAGTAGSSVTAANMPKHDSLSTDSLLTGGLNYSAEPTYESGQPLWALELYGKTSLLMEWDALDAPIINKDQLIGLIVAPRSADEADEVSGFIQFEVF